MLFDAYFLVQQQTYHPFLSGDMSCCNASVYPTIREIYFRKGERNVHKSLPKDSRCSTESLNVVSHD